MTLLVLKVNQLGDNVVFLPVIQQLVSRHPEWRIIVATSALAAPLYSETCPKVEVLEFATSEFNAAWRHPLRLAKLVHTFRELKPDICMLGNDQGNVAHLVSRLSGARFCVGPLIAERQLGPLLHQRVFQADTDSDAMKNWQIAQVMLANLSELPLPQQVTPPDFSVFGRDDHACIIIHAGASRAYKRWPMDRFVSLANQLVRTQPIMWFDQGNPQESLLSSKICRVQPCSLGKFIRLMAGASYFIGNNSGPMNIASALGIHGTIFNGPSQTNWNPVWHTERFDLLRDPALTCQPCDLITRPVNHCMNKAHPMACMDYWSVDVVHARVQARLKSSPPQRA